MYTTTGHQERVTSLFHNQLQILYIKKLKFEMASFKVKIILMFIWSYALTLNKVDSRVITMLN